MRQGLLTGLSPKFQLMPKPHKLSHLGPNTTSASPSFPSNYNQKITPHSKNDRLLCSVSCLFFDSVANHIVSAHTVLVRPGVSQNALALPITTVACLCSKPPSHLCHISSPADSCSGHYNRCSYFIFAAQLSFEASRDPKWSTTHRDNNGFQYVVLFLVDVTLAEPLLVSKHTDLSTECPCDWSVCQFSPSGSHT